MGSSLPSSIHTGGIGPLHPLLFFRNAPRRACVELLTAPPLRASPERASSERATLLPCVAPLLRLTTGRTTSPG